MPAQDVLLIHGTWSNAKAWDEFGPELTARGFTVHAPDLPEHGDAHDIDVQACAQRVAKLGLRDYVDFLKGLVEKMDTPPLIVGHSLGGLIAQLLAQEVPNRGQILIGTAPAAGIFAQYPTTTKVWSRYTLTWLRSKPMFPISKKPWNEYIVNSLPRDKADEMYTQLCAESGTVYRQMAFYFTDRTHAATVHFDTITTPVLLLAGELDKCCVPPMIKATAKKYGDRATYREVAGSCHQMTVAPNLPKTMDFVDEWLAANRITAETTA
ncbi:MAG: alpha/beta hydrolase [Gordonia sp. (in: high G+C Gram-positive bacteria)]|uniref:alpha/beta hydrolase n=1 Tax=Gordonia sp. (in: high G+C Gram-positive bacteria) TaxID=84139 RepID=UPI0039E5A431